ncbi:hypothetical protein E4U31_006133 [Claviceps sp. LM219 group G6]|nr:hypothetical protein E4U15_006022 [Claviceps sp. LM218 group G6]KAG6094839.1 hypothetical protein E4U31_006133 [Claviceps sp. LM219 group G6]KAG6113434.1 hypothetical protein E4U14_001734 [Claviceps sp. LM454 group G7]
MKLSAILGSLAIYGLQVHAVPTDFDPQAIQPIEASSPISKTLEARDGYCCAVLQDPSHNVATFIPRGSGTYNWVISGGSSRCVITVQRNPNDCSGWAFKLLGCPKVGPAASIGIRSANVCHG